MEREELGLVAAPWQQEPHSGFASKEGSLDEERLQHGVLLALTVLQHLRSQAD
jgi:hypothetical protein